MSYIDALTAVATTFTEATEIAHPAQINQAGSFLLFSGAKPINNTEDRLTFILVLAANSYQGKNGLMSTVQEMRKRVDDSKFDMTLVSVKRAELNSTTLFSVAMEIAITINLKDIPNEY